MATVFRIDADSTDFCSVQGAHLLGVYGYAPGTGDPATPTAVKLHDGTALSDPTLFETSVTTDPTSTFHFSTMFPAPVRFSGKLSASVPTGALLFVIVK